MIRRAPLDPPEEELRELHLFAGCGGGILGGILLGHRPVCAVEIEPYCRDVLLQRQRDGLLPRFPIWDDVRTFDGRDWRGRVDVVCGGFPCQDVSVAGTGDGLDGERSGLWSEMARIVREVEPRFVFVENSPVLTLRGLDRVLGDLASMGFDARWGVLGAVDAGLRHVRKRIWIVADSVRRGLAADLLAARREDGGGRQGTANGIDGWLHEPPGHTGRGVAAEGEADRATSAWLDAPCEPLLLGASDGMAHRVDRLKAIGNGQVPRVAALAWRTLTESVREARTQASASTRSSGSAAT